MNDEIRTTIRRRSMESKTQVFSIQNLFEAVNNVTHFLNVTDAQVLNTEIYKNFLETSCDFKIVPVRFSALPIL